MVPIRLAESVMLLGRAQITTQALQLCLLHGVPIYYATRNGKLLGACFSHQDGLLERRIRQYNAYQNEARRLAIAKAFVRGKILAQMAMVRGYRRRIHNLAAQEKYFQQQLEAVRKTMTISSLLGLEGETTKRYFANFSDMLLNVKWKGRNRQPPRDPVNALLSLTYMMVLSQITTVCTGAGYEAGIGFLHDIQSKRPSLACDFLELYRPMIDHFVIRLFNRGEVNESFFEKEGEGVLLKAASFAVFMEKYDTFKSEHTDIYGRVALLGQALKDGKAPDFG